MKTYIKRFWKENTLVFFLLTVTNVIQTIVSVRMAVTLDTLVNLDFESFFKVLAEVMGLFLVFLFVLNVQINKTSETKQKMATAIRTDITKRMEQSSYTSFHKKQVGTYTSWLSNDLNTIETNGFDLFYQIWGGIIATVSSVVALFAFHWSIVVMTVALTALTLGLPKLYEKKLKAASLFTTEENERFISKVTDTLNGFDTFFSFNLLQKISKNTQEASLALADAKNNQTRVTAKVAILGAFGNILGQLSVTGLTGYLVFRSLVPIGAMMATSGLAAVIFNTVGNLSQQLAAMRAVDPIFTKFEALETSFERPGGKIQNVVSGIQLQQVSYAYGNKQVLKELDASFNLGKKYAIVGASGSGKTTLLNILNGKLTDYSGSVRFSGNELNQLSGQELRHHILYMDQIPYLFQGTVRENITLGETYSDEELAKALKASSLEGVVASLPLGLDTDIGEAGRLLSGGQRQRVALARGFLRGKKIILLDEGTSSLDEESALEIEQQLLENEELTVLMITHQLRDSIRDKLDRVVVLGNA
ncbi:ABC transporter ATP-binding protein [Jeotgalibaca sp. A127]|uniref:ABC transporter ATP-binding protein n=1 Tax=Jeotgalibaca sp. A127 TaxID=3457324 RepID=UPI003FD66848